MPKQACCCNPVGRHIAVACRYYGGHTIYSLPGDNGYEGLSGSSGSESSSGNLNTNIPYGYGGDDGFLGITSGIQKLFAWAPAEPAFGNDQSGYMHRGPVRWEVDIKKFDTTRDVVILSRSGGGGSQYDYDEPEPKGGHSSMVQTRIKASLATEGFAGLGGKGYSGGFATIFGSNLSSSSASPYLIVGAGGAGSDSNFGGNGGICFGQRGPGPFGGGGGSQVAGGCAGGISAQDGGNLFGGAGANNGGGGGGGRYAGGGGDNDSGGGGGASKVPQDLSGIEEPDRIYSADGSDIGPGNVCDPFIQYYNLQTNETSSVSHAGMGGGANIIFSSDDESLNSLTRFLGYGNDFDPYKQGVPGIITAVWVDKYCPCSISAYAGLSGGNISVGNQFNEQDSSGNGSDLPSKMYICLTDDQYDQLNQDGEPYLKKFILNGEVYIYFGICVNSYCEQVRLEPGTLESIVDTNLYGPNFSGQPGRGLLLNNCCQSIVCRPICKITEADCYNCRGCGFNTCNPITIPWKYCCDIANSPERYWGRRDGYLWRCDLVDNFWYPFGKRTSDTLAPTDAIFVSFGDALNTGPFEQDCVPVETTTPPDQDAICGGAGTQDCGPYSQWNNNPSNPCNVTVPPRMWEGNLYFPFQAQASVCDPTDFKVVQAGMMSDPIDCGCYDTSDAWCYGSGCDSPAKQLTFSFDCGQGSYQTGCFSNATGHTIRASGSQDGGIIPSGCRKEVLGLRVRIPRCHPDPQNPQITDPLYAGLINYPVLAFDRILLDLCERKVLMTSGTLGDYVDAFSGIQTPVTFEVLQPNLWVTDRPWNNPCTDDNNITTLLKDPVSRIEYIDNLDERVVSVYYSPIAYYFTFTVFVTHLSNTRYDPEPCNPFCECIGGKSFKYRDGGLNPVTAWETAFSKPYYLYENPNGEPPLPNTPVRTFGPPSPPFFPIPYYGTLEIPNICDNPDYADGYNLLGGFAFPYTNCVELVGQECPSIVGSYNLVNTTYGDCRDTITITF